MAVDLAVVGLQKRPISSIVLKEGIVKVLEFGTVAVAVSLLGDDNVGLAVVVVVAGALDAVIIAFTAAMFAFRCAFSRHFFLLLRLPCPGPGMLTIKTERESKRLVLGSETGSVVLWFCGLGSGC
jgi:hypothetical protein